MHREAQHIRIASFIMLIANIAIADPNIVSEPVGFVRIMIDPGSQQLVSIPFDAFDTSINEVLKGQLTGSTEEQNADAVLEWNTSEPGYKTALKAGGTGDETKDGRWFEDFISWKGTDIRLVPGEGFFIVNKQSTTQTVFLCGTVVLNKIAEIDLVPGVSTFGYPYARNIALDDTTLKDGGAADDVVTDDEGDRARLDGETGRWVSEDGPVTDKKLLMGKAYWYEHKGDDVLEWKETRPYADFFPTDGKPPRVTEMTVGEEGKRITLTIQCTGEQGEKLDVLYQDISKEGGFATLGAWKIAVRDIAIDGRTSISWTDRGTDTRSSVDGVVARCYLVGRADIDTNGNGVPDVREIFVYGTQQPTSAIGGNDEATSAEQVVAVQETDGNTMGDNTSSISAVGGKSGTIYVNEKTGSDQFDGRRITGSGPLGPKKTINGGLSIAESGECVQIATGTYRENVSICGKNVKVYIRGTVRID